MIPDDILKQIKEKAAADHPGDYTIQAYVVKAQSDAWLELNGGKSGGAVPELTDRDKLNSLFRMTGAKTWQALHTTVRDACAKKRELPYNEAITGYFEEQTNGTASPPLDKYAIEIVNAVDDYIKILMESLKLADKDAAEKLIVRMNKAKGLLSEMGMGLKRAGYRPGVGLVFKDSGS